jgi:hypothetical protein
VFIQAKNKTYKFGRIPQFWAFLSAQLEAGTIKAPKKVYDEIAKGNDDLAAWCKVRKTKGLCVHSDKNVQDCYKQVANHVMNNSPLHQASEFLKGGDGWVIAHAMAEKGVVVTQESDRSKKQKVKVPTVCKALGVRCIDTSDMLDALDFKAV